MMNRRMVLGTGLMSVAGAMAGSALAEGRRKGFFASRGLPLGYQLYTVRDAAKSDLDGTLKQLAGIGYRRIELDGLYGRTAAQMRQSLDQAGLACTSMHVLAQPLLPGPHLSGDLGQVIADAKTLNATNIVIPLFLLPRKFTPPAGADAAGFLRAAGAALTFDDYKRMAEFIDGRARLLAPEGLRLGYHNHNVELAPLGDTTGLDYLLGHTDPSIVSFELDVGWAAAAGRDPVALLKAHPGRFTQMHVKDIKASTQKNYAMQQDPVEVGSGTIPWKEILPVAYASGTRNFFVEQEPPYVSSPIVSLKRSYGYLAGV